MFMTRPVRPGLTPGSIYRPGASFLAAKTGGPLYYRGREMKLSHVGMKIDEQDWAALMKHLNATLDKFKVPAKEHGEVVAFIESTKADIVEVQ